MWCNNIWVLIPRMEIILALLETDLAVTVIAITLIWAGSKLVTTTSLLNPCLRRYVYSSWLLYVCVHICVCVCVCTVKNVGHLAIQILDCPNLFHSQSKNMTAKQSKLFLDCCLSHLVRLLFNPNRVNIKKIFYKKRGRNGYRTSVLCYTSLSTYN